MDFDVGIVGGGPAGTALAWLLAGQHWRVLLVDDDHHRAAAPRETLLAAARPGLQRSGLWDLAAAAARPDPFRHGAVWGSAALVWRDEASAGLLLERGVFDAALRRGAVARGAVLWSGGQMGRLPAPGAAACWCDPHGQRHRVRAGFWVVATGRRPRPELVALQSAQRGPETAALSVVGCQPAASGHAVVEAVPQGWWWWIGDAARGGAATLLCDAGELARCGSRRLLAAAQQAAVGPVAALTAARLVHATRATARVLQTHDDALLLGDAAATIDPLASQGVEKAFAAAEHAAVVLQTAREQPAWWPLLREQHARWERGLFAAHAATAQAFLQQEQRFATAPFWRARLRPPALPEPPGTAPHPPEPLRVSPQVHEALVLQRQGDRFVRVEGARHDGSGDTLSHLGYVPVVPVLRAFQDPRTLAAAVAAAGADPRLFVLPPHAVQQAALVLHRYGWLVSAANAPAGH